MSKIELGDILSGYNLTRINDNFKRIEEVINDDLLAKGGDALRSDLDTNGQRVYNLRAPGSDNEAARLKDVRNAIYGDAGHTANLINYEPAGNVTANTIQGAVDQVADAAFSALTKSSRTLSVKDFGAKGDGFTDDTAAIQAAYTAFSTQFAGGTLVFPHGVYLTKSQIVFTDLYFKAIHFEGAVICGGSTASQYDAVFKIVNAESFKLTGCFTITSDSSQYAVVNNPNLYDCGLSIQAAPGGLIETARGIAAFGDIYGLTVTRIRQGVRIGDRTNDAQVAELTFHGLLTPFVPNPVYVGGSQTVVTFVGGSISSGFWPALTNPVYTTFKMEGGGVQMIGGEITNHGPTSGVVVDFTPAETSTYQNPYGGFVASGSLIETNWPVARVSNPRSLSNPLSPISHISLLGCYGYSGGLPASLGFISVDDVSYAGKIVIDEACHFYQGVGAVTRQAATINCSTAPNALVVVGRKSFETGFPHWMSGVAGGRLVHGMEHTIQAYITGGTLPAGGANLTPNEINNSPKFQRYRGMLNPVNGVITMPSVDTIDSIRFEVSVLTGASLGNIYLYDITNNRIMNFGQNTDGIANMVATVSDVSPGQQFAVVLNVNAPITFGGSTVNNYNVYLCTK